MHGQQWNWSASLLADQVKIHPPTEAAPQTGSYTLALPGNADAATQPGGNGYGSIMVNRAGLLTVAGKLADGTASIKRWLWSASGHWPFLHSLQAQGNRFWAGCNFPMMPARWAAIATWINQPGLRAFYRRASPPSFPPLAPVTLLRPSTATGLSLTNPAVILGGGNITLPLDQFGHGGHQSPDLRQRRSQRGFDFEHRGAERLPARCCPRPPGGWWRLRACCYRSKTKPAAFSRARTRAGD